MRPRFLLVAVLLLVTVQRPFLRAQRLCDSCSTFQTIATAANNVDEAVIGFDGAILGLNQPTYRVVLSLTNNLDARVNVIASTASRAALGIQAPETLTFLHAQLVAVDNELQAVLSDIQNEQDQENAAAEAIQDVGQQDVVNGALAKVVQQIQALDSAMSCVFGC